MGGLPGAPVSSSFKMVQNKVQISGDDYVAMLKPIFSLACSNCRNTFWSACRVPMEREDLLVPQDLLDPEYVHLIYREWKNSH